MRLISGLVCVGLLWSAAIGCGDDDMPSNAGTGASSGSGGVGGSSGTGGTGGTGGVSGSSGSGGTGGTGGTGGLGGSGGSSGTGGVSGSSGSGGGLGGVGGDVGDSCAPGCVTGCLQGCFQLGDCVENQPGTLALHANVETIGLRFGREDPDASATTVYYRLSGAAGWSKAVALYHAGGDYLYGSLFDLFPNSDHDVRVEDAGRVTCGTIRTLPVHGSGRYTRQLYVDDGAASDDGAGTAIDPFQTIGAALAAATPGTEIRVAPGVYRESLTITHAGTALASVGLVGLGDGVILEGTGESALDWVEDDSGIWSTAWTGDPQYVTREDSRLYHYESLADLMAGTGHNGVPIEEGYVVSGGRLVVRTLDDPSSHAWQVPALNTAITVDGASYVYIENLEIAHYGEGDYAKGIDVINDAHHIVIRETRVHDVPNPIWVRRGSDNVQIVDSEIYHSNSAEWPWDALKGTDHENSAITLQGGQGAVVHGNQIHDIFNGVYAGSFDDVQNRDLAYDVDVYDNQLARIGDDGFEPEGATINARFRDNVVDLAHNGVSLAPITVGPVWVVRNLFSNYVESGFKLSNDSSGRVWLLHNTCFTDADDRNGMNVSGAFSNVVFRNNLIRGTRYAIESTVAVSGNDLDYDALYTTRGAPVMKWNDVRYDDVAAMCTATALECHAVSEEPLLNEDFEPNLGSPLVDAALRIYGINDDFTGPAPDIGYRETF